MIHIHNNLQSRTQSIESSNTAWVLFIKPVALLLGSTLPMIEFQTDLISGNLVKCNDFDFVQRTTCQTELHEHHIILALVCLRATDELLMNMYVVSSAAFIYFISSMCYPTFHTFQLVETAQTHCIISTHCMYQ
jgi:hypothetical protein